MLGRTIAFALKTPNLCDEDGRLAHGAVDHLEGQVGKATSLNDLGDFPNGIHELRKAKHDP